MISMGKIISMIFCVVICVAVIAIPSLMIKKRSSKLETGLLGALCYGFLGYVWQYIFFIFFATFVMGTLKNTGVFLQILMTLASTALTILSLFWGIYLTNQKQRSLYRSAAIGIGFSCGKMAIELIYSNLYRVYFAFQINGGTFQADPEIKASILSTSTTTIYLDTYRCVLMFFVVFALALIMGHLYLKEDVKKMSILAGILYEVVTLVNLLLGSVIPGIAGTIVQLVFLTAVGAAAAMILWNWFRTGKVVLNPLEIMRKEK
nr:hypothetical protein [Eubacterium sp.]